MQQASSQVLESFQLTRRHCILLGKTDKTARKRRKGEDEREKLKRLHKE